MKIPSVLLPNDEVLLTLLDDTLTFGSRVNVSFPLNTSTGAVVSIPGTGVEMFVGDGTTISNDVWDVPLLPVMLALRDEIAAGGSKRSWTFKEMIVLAWFGEMKPFGASVAVWCVRPSSKINVSPVVYSRAP